MYNFEVEDWHTYFVSSESVLVHNMCIAESIKTFKIKSYSILKKDISGKGLEAHHIVEKRLAKRLGLNSNSMKSVALTKADHQNFTNRWRSAIKYGTDYRSLEKEDIWKAAQYVYKDYPDLLNAAKKDIFRK